MLQSFKVGSKVKWSWGQGKAGGVIKEKYEDTIHKTLQGSAITRNGTSDNPAYLIEQDNGSQVLKLKSEIEKA